MEPSRGVGGDKRGEETTTRIPVGEDMTSGIRDWNILDPCPGVPLTDVLPVSERAWCLMARNRGKDVLDTGFVNIAGAIEMMRGLDYHYGQFVAIMANIASEVEANSPHRTEDDIPFPVSIEKASSLNHEAVAYVNRIGQIATFARSTFMKNQIGNTASLIPTLTSLLAFRNKHSAHRSLDDPRPEDTPDLQRVHARSLAPFGRLFQPKVSGTTASIHTLWKDCYLCYQIYDDKAKNYATLVIQRDHETIINEAYSLIEKLIATSS
jgi:hypothetical protein